MSYLLRQATGIAKAPHVAAFVQMLVEAGERPPSSAGITRSTDLDGEAEGPEARALHRPETQSQKDAAVAAFLKGESKVLILSLRLRFWHRRSAEGLELRGLRRLDWSPGVHEQVIGRARVTARRAPSSRTS